MALPNKHCLPIDLTPFGMANRKEPFVPTDEPHGQIDGTAAR
jgi:urate oxidase